MDKIAEFLIQKETITGKEFMQIFREVKGIPEPEEKEPASETSKPVAEDESITRADASEPIAMPGPVEDDSIK